jgi:hypothetical protein
VVEGLELGFWGLRTVEEWAAEDAALERAGALPNDIGKKARIASSSMSPPSAMGALVDGEEGFRFESGASGSGAMRLRVVPEPVESVPVTVTTVSRFSLASDCWSV